MLEQNVNPAIKITALFIVATAHFLCLAWSQSCLRKINTLNQSPIFFPKYTWFSANLQKLSILNRVQVLASSNKVMPYLQTVVKDGQTHLMKLTGPLALICLRPKSRRHKITEIRKQRERWRETKQ